MLSKTIKIAASCVLACSLSYLGKASDPIIEQNGSPSLSSSISHPSATHEILIQPTSEETSSSSLVSPDTSPDTNDSSKSAGKRKKVSRAKSTSSKSSTTKIEQLEAAPKKVPLSTGMKVELPSKEADMLATFGYYLLPKVAPPISEGSLAPGELLPIHLLLALLVEDQKAHRMVYIPDKEIFLGYQHMLRGTQEQLKKALKFSDFQNMANMRNALSLLSIHTKKDLEKPTVTQDMDVARELITETQKEQWYQTRVKAKINLDTERRDPSTLGLLVGPDNAGSNYATYILYRDGHRLDPRSLEENPTLSSKEKSKLKSKSKSKTETETKSEEWLEVSLSISALKTKEQPRSLKREKSTASRKRSGSKGASAASSSAIESPSSPRVEEEKAHENSPCLPAGSTQPSLTPPSTGV